VTNIAPDAIVAASSSRFYRPDRGSKLTLGCAAVRRDDGALLLKNGELPRNVSHNEPVVRLIGELIPIGPQFFDLHGELGERV